MAFLSELKQRAQTLKAETFALYLAARDPQNTVVCKAHRSLRRRVGRLEGSQRPAAVWAEAGPARLIVGYAF